MGKLLCLKEPVLHLLECCLSPQHRFFYCKVHIFSNWSVSGKMTSFSVWIIRACLEANLWAAKAIFLMTLRCFFRLYRTVHSSKRRLVSSKNWLFSLLNPTSKQALNREWIQILKTKEWIACSFHRGECFFRLCPISTLYHNNEASPSILPLFPFQ